MLEHATASKLAETYGDSFYVFDRARFLENYEAFLSGFRAEYPDTHVAYSYKTNYTPAICRLVDDLGGFAEIVSSMEYELAARLGVSTEKIIYNGPYKTAESVGAVLRGGGLVNIDSIRDVELLEDVLAEQKGEVPGRVALRCNFDVGADRVSRFGMDVDGDEFAAVLGRVRAAKALRLVGLHCHFQDRDLGLFERRMSTLLSTADRVFGDEIPEVLNIGGGYFGRLPDSLRERYGSGVPEYQDYGSALGGAIAEHYSSSGQRPRLFTEPGTALVADTFRFVTRVIGRKEIRGKRFLFVAGSIFNTSPYSRVAGLPVTVLSADPSATEAATYDVCGYTCIEKDVLSSGVELAAEVGDLLRYDNVGSYSIGMKPPFILPNVPIIMDTGEGFEVIKRSETTDDVFRTFSWI